MEYLESIDPTEEGFADHYDELPLWSAPFGLRLLDRVPLRAEGTYLDVGAGTGFLTLELAQRCGAGSKVIAVDPWTDAMARLRRKLERLGLDNVVLREQDAAKLDLPDASIDVIVSNLGLNNFENAPAVADALWRVAKPGARLILTTNLTGHMAEFYAVFRNTLTELGHDGRALDDHVRHRGTVESVRALIETVGFVISEVERGSFQLRFADGSALLRHHFIRLGFVPAWASIVPEGARQETFEALERNLNAVAEERGELSLTIPLACIEAHKPGAGNA